MSVTKYRHVADMPSVVRTTGPDLARRIRAIWARSRRLAAVIYTPGVHKYSSIEAAQQAREQAIRARMQQLRKRRLGGQAAAE